MAEPVREVAERDPEMVEPGREVAERDPEMAEPGREVAERDPEMVERGREVAERGREVAERDPEVAERLSPAGPAGPVCTFLFRKPGRRGAVGRRQRGVGDPEPGDSGDEDEGSCVVRPGGKRAARGPRVQTTRGGHRRAGGASGCEEEAEEEGEEEEEERGAPRVVYKSTRSAKPVGPEDMGATAVSEPDPEEARREEPRAGAHGPTYRGLRSYRRLLPPRDARVGPGARGLGRVGPLRAPEHLRATVRWDYQPDLCKDFKETGFCGFGDSCKFLHDRSDYKHGWQIARELAEGRHGAAQAESYEVGGEGPAVPAGCPLCRRPFRRPVVTRCRHCFCERCALERYRASPRCSVCGRQTHGVFNPAKELLAQLRRRPAAEEDGEATEGPGPAGGGGGSRRDGP
ncbi:E3 ubiquitin-protein ligase RNF113A-like [Myotis myotis]|uniref:E3 ubiquitin-protein ligase RNF113A-like n=1 Tax=Myotis myotis TaxID=51298 RepID=UPI00174EC518|nr:E3 ubiquitin-protein ligase RNF113A-like [Myotis myotis]